MDMETSIIYLVSQSNPPKNFKEHPELFCWSQIAPKTSSKNSKTARPKKNLLPNLHGNLRHPPKATPPQEIRP